MYIFLSHNCVCVNQIKWVVLSNLHNFKLKFNTTETILHVIILQGSSSQRPSVPIPLYICFQQTLGGCGIINIGRGATLVQPLLS